MQIIPVLDIKAGEIVRAWRGRRDQYRPLHCSLCGDSKPGSVMASLLKLYPFRIVYMADIDAITGHGDNLAAVSQLAGRHPEVTFWLDAGWRAPAHAIGATADSRRNLTAIVGSETLASLDALVAIAENRRDDLILSLDYDGDGFRGPRELETRSDLWPRRVILMELNRVGAGTGPAFDRLNDMRRRHPQQEWYAAGGVRSVGDLHRLAADHVDGALVATVLYDGTLAAEDIAAFNR